MVVNPNEAFLASSGIEMALAQDDGSAAQEHLAAGFPIYYCDDRYPDGVVKEYPDGHKELVTIGASEKIEVIRSL